jgi:hypothetical protein
VSTDEVYAAAGPGQSWPVLVGGLEGCDESSPVASLDQLFSQAVAVTSELDALCRDWAATSDGELVGGRVTFDGGFEELVRAGLVKRPERAAAKVLACYGGDPSRLLDVCRRRIAFGRVAELGACLGRMGADSSVRVVRVKNLLREDADPRVTAGFRVRGFELDSWVLRRLSVLLKLLNPPAVDRIVSNWLVRRDGGSGKHLKTDLHSGQQLGCVGPGT